MFKPMLAKDYIESKLQFPFGYQPKIDGVRGMHTAGYFSGRSLMPPANVFTANYYNDPIFTGLDGEFAAEHECHSALCRLTSSAMSTQAGEPYLLWHVFDLVLPDVNNLSYYERYNILSSYIENIKRIDPDKGSHLRLVPMFEINSLEQLYYQDDIFLNMGYEGGIIRNMESAHKEGRSTVNEQGLLRVKHFTEEDARVLQVIEGESNNNEAVINLLGRTERSSHKENKVGNGMIGSLLCLDIKTNKEIIVAAGALTHKERKYYFDNPHEIINEIIKYKSFPKGVKDKPRFPTFQSIRPKFDLV